MAFKLKNLSKRDSIKKDIVEWIKNEKLLPGDRISSQTQLAKVFNTTQVTIHKALREMVDEGVLKRVKGRGTYFNSFAPIRKSRIICYVLPGKNLDSPEVNPIYWPYVQTIISAFINATHEKWLFTTKGVSSSGNMNQVAEEMNEFAAVFFHYSKQPRELIKLLIKQKKVPVFCQGMPDHELNCTSIDHDKIGGARMAVSHMIGLGYKRIAFMASSEFWGKMAYEGYKKALVSAGFPVDERLVSFVTESKEDVFRAVSALLKKNKFDAIFVDEDIRALAVIEILKGKGLKVPEDIGVMGYDGIDFAIKNPPYLSTVRIPFERLISAALEEVEKNTSLNASASRQISMLGEVNNGATLRGS